MRTTLLLALGTVPLATLVAMRSPAPAPPAAPPWEAFQKFAGDWEGESDGQFGAAVLTKSWSFALNEQFLHCRTKSVAASEVHEDWSMLSYDKDRKVFVLREFHSEGYVNQYKVEVFDEGLMFVFETESVENGFSPGLRAQTTIHFVSEDEIAQEFALASPGEDWNVCASSTLRRAAPSDEAR